MGILAFDFQILLSNRGYIGFSFTHNLILR
jgi:hypothetical protein